MNAPDWSASQYLKFEDERTRPARDLLAQVSIEKPSLVVDLGCGPGNSTELLAKRWPDAEVRGVDTSPDMLDKAGARLPALTFDLADAATWQPDRAPDVIFANAVFQWLPDHMAIFERLMGLLAPGGMLAVQMPDNLAEPSHALMREAADAMLFSDKFPDKPRTVLPKVAAYYSTLAPLSRRVDIWHTLYNHPLDGADAIVEWLKSTGLRPYLAPLDAAEQDAFLAHYRQLLENAYPEMPDGKVLLRFPRLFIIAMT